MWGKYSEKLQYKVYKCVNFAGKLASNGKYFEQDHVTPLLKDLKWINFNGIFCLLNDASIMHKNLNVPTDLNVKKYYL